MRMVVVALSMGMAVGGGAFAVVACVSPDPGMPPLTGAVQGQLGGACFADGSCNVGLSCAVEDGSSRCRPSGGASGDGGPSNDSGDTIPDASTGLPVCRFQTTPYPCGGQTARDACYGATQDCTITSCSDLRWSCNSRRQCGTACCVSDSVATLSPGESCTEGTLLIKEGAREGASCAPASTTCGPGEFQLCQANEDCPPGQQCKPVKVIGQAAGALQDTILAACVRP